MQVSKTTMKWELHIYLFSKDSVVDLVTKNPAQKIDNYEATTSKKSILASIFWLTEFASFSQDLTPCAESSPFSRSFRDTVSSSSTQFNESHLDGKLESKFPRKSPYFSSNPKDLSWKPSMEALQQRRCFAPPATFVYPSSDDRLAFPTTWDSPAPRERAPGSGLSMLAPKRLSSFFLPSTERYHSNASACADNPPRFQARPRP